MAMSEPINGVGQQQQAPQQVSQPQQQQQFGQQQQQQLRSASQCVVPLSRLIDFSIQRTYHELQVLADL